VQPSRAPLSQGEQVALLCGIEAGALDAAPLEAVAAVRRVLRKELESRSAPTLMRLDAGETPTVSDRELIVTVVRELGRVAEGEAGHGRE
jgi:hypothetical protein